MDTRFLKLRLSGNGLIVSFQWKVDGPIIQMLKKRKKGRNWPKFGVSVGEITGKRQLPGQKSGKAWFSLYLVELTAARKSSRPPRTPRNYSGNTEPSGWPRGELKPRAQRSSLSPFSLPRRSVLFVVHQKRRLTDSCHTPTLLLSGWIRKWTSWKDR